MKRLNSVLLAASVGLGLSGSAANAAAVLPYFQTNLVSDLSGVAPVHGPQSAEPLGCFGERDEPALDLGSSGGCCHSLHDDTG